MRRFIANTIIAFGLWIAPRAFSWAMVRFLEAAPRMLEELEKGREGGIVLIPWGVTDEGMNLARTQLHFCTITAGEVRAEIEKYLEKSNAQTV